MINKDGNKVVVIYGRKREKEKKKDAQRFCQKLRLTRPNTILFPLLYSSFELLNAYCGEMAAGDVTGRSFTRHAHARSHLNKMHKKNRKKKIENDKIFLIVINLKIIVCRVCVCKYSKRNSQFVRAQCPSYFSVSFQQPGT